MKTYSIQSQNQKLVREINKLPVIQKTKIVYDHLLAPLDIVIKIEQKKNRAYGYGADPDYSARFFERRTYFGKHYSDHYSKTSLSTILTDNGINIRNWQSKEELNIQLKLAKRVLTMIAFI